MYYINFKGPYGTETVSEANTLKEAQDLFSEYALYPQYVYKISKRATKAWRESHKEREDKANGIK